MKLTLPRDQIQARQSPRLRIVRSRAAVADTSATVKT